MNCFHHHDRPAVGLCKSCSKGVCSECAVELNKGLACKGACEADVASLVKLIDRNIQLSETSAHLVHSSKKVRNVSAIFYGAMGVLFVGWGMLRPDRGLFLGVMGVLFVVYGVYLGIQFRQPPQPPKQ